MKRKLLSTMAGVLAASVSALALSGAEAKIADTEIKER